MTIKSLIDWIKNYTVFKQLGNDFFRSLVKEELMKSNWENPIWVKGGVGDRLTPLSYLCLARF